MKKKTGIIIGIVAVVIVIAVIAVVAFSGGFGKKEQPVSEQVVESVTPTPAAVEGSSAENADSTATPATTSTPVTTKKPAATKAPASSKAPEQDATPEPISVKPAFMYFVTNADLENKELIATLDALKKEYADRVNFDIKNIDIDPSLLERFAFVSGQTPALIMLNSKTDIAALVMKSSNQEELKTAIETGLK